ncbi:MULTISPECIES: undecaprenyldiphospho-muramoylpentapeptide beta-N-acetylglucosaminyltransferase [unclassified Francisella]|uniref:undecaprenyldiphospho-muramoylpentapeptide beta-N-acetylglucosaminyltransferase n=1 Tax=unclassified Francisella TaxID=2610885 RepID=UPI002E371455|nr:MULTISPECIES: undecaprenyldiphospho-muramoylpentapeptide beta-N-acetylglucosaminyltransferase [unclassified Francisella]MED7818600.1 undecaprenyldiphospho-muramoylpentapeptide beta-N-acetylglucosaminyltransferase [Francisella sp. 19S2-4]MED7829436.1 undecaprenyldiphospho-muramoylpentapeptide beta-N-acetylglucosaminyltransferase [Francisella sp. 19S2-10]
MNLENKNIIITAGGTGGHIYPALAVAELLKQNKANVTWVGTPNSMEANIVPKYFNIQYIKSSGIRGKGIIRKITFPIKLILSTIKARSILKKFKTDLVIGFGGYVSGPICLAAVQKKIPIIIHEQNAKIGLTNRVLAKLATKICLAFEIDNIKDYFNQKQLARTKVVGNPVRKDIVALNNKSKNFSNSQLKLLIIGGSQGAKAINDIIPNLIAKALDENLNIKVWHQTGKLSFEETKDNYKDIPHENIKDISAFIFDMAEAYDWADLIICRAGALTVSECAVAGLPTIFIPLPSAVDDHQFFNAQNIVKNGAGFCLRQQEMTLENLIDIIKPLAQNKTQLERMSQIAKKTLIKDSSEQILECVKEILNKNN